MKRSGREVMKGEMEGKWKIAGAVIAVMLVISVLAAVIPIAFAKTVSRTYDKVGGDITLDNKGIVTPDKLGEASLVTVFIGEEVTFNGAVREVHIWGAYDSEGNPKEGFAEITVVAGSKWDTAGLKEGFYKVCDDADGDGTFRCEDAGANKGWVTLDTQEFTLDLEPAKKIAEDAPIFLEIASNNKEGGVMKIDLKDEEGFSVSTIFPVDVNYNNKRNFVSLVTPHAELSLPDDYPAPGGDTYHELRIDTEALDLEKGKYTIYVKDKATEVEETIEFTIGPKEIEITAPEEATVGETVEFTVETSYPDEDIWIDYDDGTSDSGRTDEEGKIKFTHSYEETGTYDVEVTVDSNNNNILDDDDESKEFTIRIESGKISVDVTPKTVTLGSKIYITGTTTLPDDAELDIIIENHVTIGPDDEPDFDDIDHTDGAFDVEWDTSEHVTDFGLTEDSYKVIVYNDANGNNERDPDEEYDTATVTLISGEISFEVVDSTISTIDEIHVRGNVTGDPDEVYLIIVGENFAGYRYDISVSDGTFDEDDIGAGDFDSWYTPQGKIGTMDEYEPGTYTLVIQHPGPDETPWIYPAGQVEDPTDKDLKENGRMLASSLDSWIANMEADVQDDELAFSTIKISNPTLTLNPIDSIRAGEPLNVSGDTTRADGTTIFIRVTGPGVDTTESVTVENDGFEYTFDTTGWEPGTYSIYAEDMDREAMDEITVEVLAAVPSPTPSPTPTASPTPTPTPTPSPSPTPTPTVSPVATPTPTPTPSPSPSPTPGFEALFAVAGLLAVTYFVLRRKK